MTLNNVNEIPSNILEAKVLFRIQKSDGADRADYSEVRSIERTPEGFWRDRGVLAKSGTSQWGGDTARGYSASVSTYSDILPEAEYQCPSYGGLYFV